jgi:hypothetical protein
MSDDADDMHARHQARLRKFQAQGEELADLLHARAKAAAEAGDAEAARAMAGAWHRIARSVRQSMALEALLMRQRARDEREAEEREELAEAVEAGHVKPHHRVGGRLVWHEAEKAESYEDFLMRVAEKEAEKVARIAADPEAHMAWLRARAAETAKDVEYAESRRARGVPPDPGPLQRAAQEGLIVPLYGVDRDTS